MKKLISWLAVAIISAASVMIPLAFAATLYSSNVCAPLPTPGDPASQNTWGTLLNTGTRIIDAILGTSTSISVAGNTNVVLTFNCGTLDQTDAAHFTFTGALTGNIVVLWPNGRGRTFSVTNATTGAFTLSLGANNGSSLPAGATVVVPQGYTGEYRSTGTDVLARVTSGGLAMAANSVAGNAQNTAGPGADLAIPNCTGALTYTSGTGFGCGAGGGGGGGTGLAFGGVQTANFTAAANTNYCIDTTGGTVLMTLPASPVAGNQIQFTDCASFFGNNPMTVANNGQLLMGLNQNMIVGTPNAAAILLYAGPTNGWRMQ